MCTKCGSEIGREVAFCPICGESLFQENFDK
ncbi:MAG: zinc-ribbon domain-containing protein [Promethearchaeota archaeon]